MKTDAVLLSTQADQERRMQYMAFDLRWMIESVGLDPTEAIEPARLQQILEAFYPHEICWTHKDEMRRQRFARMDLRDFASVCEVMRATVPREDS